MSGFTGEDAISVLPLNTYNPGTYTSDPIWPDPGVWEQFQLNVWVRDTTGVPTGWITTLETSTNGTTWTAVPGSSTPALIAAGSAFSNAQAPPNTLVRVRTVITGLGATMTGRVYALATTVL